MYEFMSEIPFENPVMIAALSGWVDAAAVATGVATHLSGEDKGALVEFDSDKLFDYRSNRPVLDIVNGLTQEIAWPKITVTATQFGGRDIALLSGGEPDFRWQEFAGSIVELAHRLNVTFHVTLGAVPAAVPHTLPPPILATASDPTILVGGSNLPEGVLRVPGAAVSVVDRALYRSGVPTVGFFAQVPHYVTGPYWAGVNALLERVAAQLGVEVSLRELQEQAMTQREQLDEIVAGRPDAQEYVQRLQELADEENLPSGEDLAAEIERYFRQGGEGGSFDDPGGS